MAGTKTKQSKTAPGPGRPAVQDAARTEMIAVRVTPEEFDRIKAAAQADDRDVSSWLRRLARREVGLSG